MVCFLTPVSLLQMYFVITSQKSQGIYLLQAAFVQRLILTRFSPLLNYKFYPPTRPERLVEPCHEAGGRSLSYFGTLNWGLLGLIMDSLDALWNAQVNIPVVSDDGVETYICSRHGTNRFEVEGESYRLAPDGLLGTVEYVISGKIRVGRIHYHYWESSPSLYPTGWEGTYKGGE